jgi:tetratricopeptide (TPR) repeat protein
MEQKDYTNALSSYQTSLRLDSTSFDAAEGAAKADMAQGDYNNAYAVIAKVEAYAKTDAERARFLYIRAVSLEQLNLPDPAYRDWTALLALPPEALTDEMRAKAQVRVVELRSPTPIPGTSTPSRTPSPTSPPATRQPSKTPKPTATRAASATPVVLTPTASATPVVIMEATLTPTPKK